MRIIILTSSPYGTASRCLPELVASDKIEVLSVVLVEGGVSTISSYFIRRWGR